VTRGQSIEDKTKAKVTGPRPLVFKAKPDFFEAKAMIFILEMTSKSKF